MIPDRFRGYSAVVTGAGSGIGQATARRLVAESADVVIIDRSEDGLNATLAMLEGAPTRVIPIRVDCLDEGDVAAAFDRVEGELGSVDILVASTGIELADSDGRLDQVSLDGWDLIVRTNLNSQFLACKHALRLMVRAQRGAVVCVGSNTAILGMATAEPAYSASKGAIHAMMKVTAIDFARHNIRVNMVIPGFIDTPMNAAVMADQAQRDYWQDQVPLGRAGRADEVAAAILWLASDDASYCVGTMLVVDGGQSSV